LKTNKREENMRLSLALITSIGLISTAAMAGPMDNVYGNTLQVVENGQTSSWFINEDGTFTTDSGASGTWALSGPDMCVTIGAATNCSPIEERTVGQSWTEDDGQGGTRTATLVAGR
jgi:hypothetical protein